MSYRTSSGDGHSNNNLVDKKDTRKRAILELLKGGGHLTIKDFSSVIRDCSEKTIQRELLALVEENVLKKEGERRWSRYFIALAQNPIIASTSI